jgi:hypothetical protein
MVSATTTLLYSGGLYAVYLSTPHGILNFYLSTSGVRTMATATMSLLVGLFFLLSQFEKRTEPTGDNRSLRSSGSLVEQAG